MFPYEYSAAMETNIPIVGTKSKCAQTWRKSVERFEMTTNIYMYMNSKFQRVWQIWYCVTLESETYIVGVYMTNKMFYMSYSNSDV